MKKSTLHIALISLLLLQYNQIHAGQFTWTGSVDTVFTNKFNWSIVNSSADYPSSNDSMYVSTITSNRPVLDQSRDVYYLRMMPGSLFDLKSYTFTVQNEAIFDGGTMSNGDLVVRGTIAKFNGSSFTSDLDIEAGVIELNGGTFDGVCRFKVNGNSVSIGLGGCVFSDEVTLIQAASRTKWTLAASNGDIFNGVLKVYQMSDSPLYLSNSDTTYYNGNVLLNNTGSAAVLFGEYDGVSYLASGKTIAVGDSGYASGDLYIRLFYQQGNTNQNLALTGTAGLFLKGAHFEAKTTLSAPGVICDAGSFQDSVTIIKTGTGSNHWWGDNDFYGTAVISNTGSGSATDELRLSGVYGNRFYANAVFNSGSKALTVDFKDQTDFHGDVSINHIAIIFEKSVIFKGSNNQTLYGTTGYSFKNVTLDKTSGTVTADTTLEVSGVFTFTSGYLVTDTLHLLTMTATSSAEGASNASFVNGPVKKVGDSAFEFPVGKELEFAPILISAPDSIYDSFMACYFNIQQTLGMNMDTLISGISNCNYWKLDRLHGESSVKATLYWKYDSCFPVNSEDARVVSYNNDMWINAGNSGNHLKAGYNHTSSDDFISVFNALTIGFIADGGSFVSAIQLTSSQLCADSIYEKTNSNIWFRILTDSSRIEIGVKNINADIYHPTIMNIHLIHVNNGVNLPVSEFWSTYMQDSIPMDTVPRDSLTVVSAGLGFFTSGEFLIHLETAPTCDSCLTDTVKFRLCIKESSNRISTTPFVSFEDICGLRFTTGSVRMQQRLSPIPGVGLGQIQPAQFNVNLPQTGTIRILGAYLYALGVGNNTANLNNINFQVNGNNNNISMTQIDTDPNPTCWQTYANTNVYRQDVTSLVSSNVNSVYAINGLPTVNCDWDGVSLIIVYQDCDGNPNAVDGYFYLYDGLEVRSGGGLFSQTFGFTQTSANNYSNSRNFFAIGDVEQPNQTLGNIVLGNNASFPGIISFIPNNFYGLWTVPGLFVNPVNSNWSIGIQSNSTDCFAIPFVGAYYRDPDDLCDYINVSISETPACNGVVMLSANASPAGNYSYQWNTGATTQSINVTIPGTYTVTVSGSGICFVTESYTSATPIPALSVVLTPTHRCHESLGTVTSIVSGGTPPYTYLWNNGNTSSSISGLPAGTYTLTVTDALGCTVQQSATVQSDNTNYVIVGPESNCVEGISNQQFQIVPYNSQNATYYNWTLSSNLTLVSFNTNSGEFTIQFTQPLIGGTITVSYFNPITFCSFATTHTVFDCCRNGTYTIADGVISDICGFNSSYCTTQGNLLFIDTGTDAIALNGLITVDQDVVINSTLRFGEGASLNTSGNDITFNNSLLEAGCNVMWKGVQVTAGSVARLNNTTIRDAQFGLDISNNGSYLINNGSFFNMNYIGMRVTGPDFTIRLISDCAFGCTSVLLSPYLGQAPVPCSITYAGMELINVLNGMSIGDPTYTSGPVHFRDINIGILSRNSSLFIYNSRFDDIQELGTNACFSSPITDFRGSGVAQLGSDARPPSFLFQRGFGDGSNSDFSFSNCRFGIHALNSTVDIQLNHMEEVNIGIYLRMAGAYMQNLIFQNRITAFDKCTYIRNPSLFSDVKIYYNHFIADNTASVTQGNRRAGVHVEQVGVSSVPDHVSVRDNYIEVDNARMGIVIENIANTDALENIIDVTGTGTNKHGLYLLNLQNHRSGCNTITQIVPDVNTGINSSTLLNAVIGCNHTFDFNRGIQLRGTNSGIQFLGNNMNDGNVGLLLGSFPVTVIGRQINRGNLWNGTFNSNGAILQPNNSINQNLFRVEGFPNPPLWPPNVSPPNWFSPSACTNCTFDCDDTPAWVCDDGVFRLYRSVVSSLDSMIVNGDTLSDEYVEETIRQARRLLYEEMLLNPDLVDDNELMEDFFSYHADSVYSRLATIRYMFHDFMESNIELHNSITLLATERDSIMKLVLINDSLIWDGISGNDSLDLLDESESFRNMIHEINEQFDPSIEQLEESEEDVVSTASEINSSLESMYKYTNESNEYMINKISFDLYLENRDTLTGSEISVLESIVYQCPTTGGKAVYEARGLYYRYINDSISFDDDTLCNPPARMMLPEVSFVKDKETFCKVYPNPANESLSVEYFLGNNYEEDACILLTEFTDRQVYKKTLLKSSGITDMDISQLSEGIYLVLIKSGNKVIYFTKVIVTH